jgi:hypothetical protein
LILQDLSLVECLITPANRGLEVVIAALIDEFSSIFVSLNLITADEALSMRKDYKEAWPGGIKPTNFKAASSIMQFFLSKVNSENQNMLRFADMLYQMRFSLINYGDLINPNDENRIDKLTDKACEVPEESGKKTVRKDLRKAIIAAAKTTIKETVIKLFEDVDLKLYAELNPDEKEQVKQYIRSFTSENEEDAKKDYFSKFLTRFLNKKLNIN